MSEENCHIFGRYHDASSNYFFTICILVTIARTCFLYHSPDLKCTYPVMNTYSEPICGWSSSLQNAGALILGIGLGVLRIMNLNYYKRADVIPVDKCASALVALPWHICTSMQNNVLITPIFNHVSDRNPVTWGSAFEMAFRMLDEEKISPKYQVWAVSLSLEPNVFLYNIKFFIYQVLPLPLFVLAETLKNQPPRIRRAYTKIAVTAAQTRPFTSKNWTFFDNNILNMWSSMSNQDRRLFSLDVGDINWKIYLRGCARGAFVYVLNESAQSKHSFKFKMFTWAGYILSQIGNAIKIFFVYKTSVLGYNFIANLMSYEINRIHL